MNNIRKDSIIKVVDRDGNTYASIPLALFPEKYSMDNVMGVRDDGYRYIIFTDGQEIMDLSDSEIAYVLLETLFRMLSRA